MTNILTFLTINQSKWPVQFSKDIYASSETVWNLISQPGNLENCHPFCKQNIVDKWPGDNSRDTIEYLNGWKFERKLLKLLFLINYFRNDVIKHLQGYLYHYQVLDVPPFQLFC